MQKLLVIGLFFGMGMSFSQTADSAKTEAASKYEKELVAGLNFANSYYENWAAGGEDAVNWNIKVAGKLSRDFNRFNWSNEGKFQYGMTKIDDQDFRKSSDEIFLESMLAFKWLKVLNPYFSLTVQSQFDRGYAYADDSSYIVSNFWDPGYITQSLGLKYSPKKQFSTRLGFSLKESFSENYGYADKKNTTEIETFKAEPGLESITSFSTKFNQILLYDTKLSVFVNFLGVEEIDGRWENNFTAQIAKYLNVSFGFELFYDIDQSDSYQLKESITLGVNYNFL